MHLSFFGAAGEVTGSCHLLESGGKRLLVDCGMFQGSRALDEENGGPFPFDPTAVDALLLTHAHLDHCGRIPLLVKRGFRGRILTTPATRELAELVLLDAAGLQREELRRPDRRHPDHHPPQGKALEPLFDERDVQAALARFEPVMEYGRRLELFPGLAATFHNAGHILGSAWILLECAENGVSRRLLFTGDMGSRQPTLVNPPEPSVPVEALISESTYGDRNHRSLADSVTEFKSAVAATLQRGGNAVIPCFALERAQQLLFFLREAVEENVIPAATPVFLDSPMAISATAIFRRHAELFNPPTRALLSAGHDPFQLPGLQFTRDTAASKAINDVRGGAVIMAGSGMAAGGRILHHLQRNLDRPECSVIIVGYASTGTLARQIVDRARLPPAASARLPGLRIYGQPVGLRATVHTIGGFSAHADHDDLLAWIAGCGPAARIFLVHGENGTRASLARDLAEAGHAQVTSPLIGQSFQL